MQLKKYFWGILMCLLAGLSYAQSPTQQVTAIQYFYNTDPGVGIVGNGGVIQISPTANYTQTLSLTIPGFLSNGFNNLYIRAKDEFGRWSIAERRLFYIHTYSNTENIVAYQYYIDNDPGVGISGNGGVINVSSTAALTTNLNLNIPPGLTNGLHALYIRAKDVSGQWSLAERRLFFVDGDQLTTSITAMEYYFDTDPGVGNANPYTITPGSSVNITASIGVPCLTTGTHYLYIRAKDPQGRWSIIERDTLSVTSGVAASVVSPAGPISLCAGDSVLLSATPVVGATYQWLLNGIDIPGANTVALFVDSAGSYSLKTTCGVSFTTSNVVVLDTVSALTYYLDADGDGFGNPLVDSSFCFEIPGWVSDNNDCDDADFNRNPGAFETCNDIDDNCDGFTDEGLLQTFYLDADGDNYGNPNEDSLACSNPIGYVSDATDCDDSNPLINTASTEICFNGIDDNCNLFIDEGPTVVAGPDQQVCGDSAFIAATGVVSFNSLVTVNPPAGYWSVISGNGVFEDSSAFTTLVRQLAPGVNIFRFTSIQDSCIGFDEVEIYATPKPILSLIGLLDSICLNANSFFLNALPSGGVYSGTSVVGNLFNPQLVGLQQIRYTTPPYYGCPADSIEQEIKVLALPTVSIQASSGLVICENGSLELSVISSSSNIEWSTGSNLTTINVIDSGSYFVTAVGENGCINKDSVLITQEIKPEISINGSTAICPGESRILSITNVNTVLWSTGAASTTITVAPTTSTTYTVTGVSVNGCTVLDSVLVNVNPNLPPTAVTNMFPANNAQGVSLPINFSWLPGLYNASYDLYFWPSSSAVPTTPSVAGITSLNYVATSGFTFGQTYSWKIVSHNGNCFSVTGPVQTFATRELPDLQVSNVQGPLTGFSGQSISVAWLTNNIGNGVTGSTLWTDGVYLSLDTLFQPFDIFLGGSPNISALNSGQSYSALKSFNIPNSVSGNYYILVISDQFLQLAEANEGNNRGRSLSQISITVPPLPDIRVTNMVTVSNAFSGDTITLTYTVKNFGGAPTAAINWKDNFYATDQPFLNLQQTPPVSNAIHSGNLLPDSSYTKVVQIPLPKYVFGPFYIYTVTDILNQVNEGVSENNNSGSTLLDIFLTPPPDLNVEFFSTPTSAGNEESILLNWRVKNIGFTPTDNSWSDRIYLSSNPSGNLNNSILLGTFPIISSLQPDNFYNQSASITLPNVPAGEYYLYVKTDALNQVFEYASEQNNLRRSDTVFTILNTDLIIDSINAVGTVSAGTSTEITWRIRNIGNGGVFNKTRKDVIYLSTSMVFNPATALAIDSISFTESIPAGAVRLKQKLVTIPPQLNGTYYLFVMCDKGNTILEIDELNNINSVGQAIAIDLSSWTDLEGLSFVIPDTIETLTTYNVQYEVANNGLLVVNGNWSDSIFVSRQPVWNRSSAVWLSNESITKLLNTGDFYQEISSVSLPLLQQIPGTGNTMYLYVKIDAKNGVFEHTAENNNILRSNAFYSFDNYVDHELLQLIGPDSSLSGRPAIVQWTVKNNGGRSSFNNYNTWRDVILLSSDTLPDANDNLVNILQVSDILTTGNTYTKSRTVTIPNGISGSYYLIAFTDYYDQINGEILRSNNYAVARNLNGNPIAINIIASPTPDLVVQSMQAPSNGISGQPLKVYYQVKNTGIGDTYPASWRDGLNLSSNPSLASNGIGTFLKDKQNTSSLLPDSSYSDSIEVTLPMVATGNYYLKLNVDQTNVVYEGANELNNRSNALITITQPLPSDLMVENITTVDSAITGQQIPISWTLLNRGLNPATGITRHGIYLSLDTIVDVSDYLLGTFSAVMNVSPGGSTNQSTTLTAAGVEIGMYYVIVAADLLNNIPESNETNNRSASLNKIYIGVKNLPLSTNVLDTLSNEEEVFYSIKIPDSLAGQTLLVTINGASLNWSNELYISHEKIPSGAIHDYSYSLANDGDQDIIIPSLLGGTYYLLAKGIFQLALPSPPTQSVILRADILPFAIRVVDANKGGNNGNVTVKLSGSKFNAGMTTQLKSTFSAQSITASNVYFINSTTVFATFALNQKPLGIYDVVLTKLNGDTARFSNGFEIEAGNSGGFYVGGISNSGMTGSPGTAGCSPGTEAGLNGALQINVTSPANAFSLSTVPMSIQFGNTGNTDIPIPTRMLISVDELPISFNIAGLSDNNYQLFVEFIEQNGPPGILRAGSSGTINFFVYTTRTFGKKQFKLQ